MRSGKTVTLITVVALLVMVLFTGASTLASEPENDPSGNYVESLQSKYLERRSHNPNGYRMGLLPSKPDPRLELDTGKYLKATPLKTAVDLSDEMPPIGDQGNQGSCVGWATSYYYKTWWEKLEHPSWNLEDPKYVFSPSFVYNQINGGQDAGAVFEDAFPLLESTGTVDIEEFPYNDADCTTQPSSSQKETGKQYMIPGQPDWGYFFKNDVDMGGLGPFDNSITEVKALLDSGFPLVFGIPVFSDFPGYEGNPESDFYNYEGYYPDYDFLGGHAVCIVGYDDNAGGGQGGFLMVNSWGPSWNGNGMVYLSYEFVRQWVWEAWFMEDNDSSPKVSGVSPSTVGPGGTVAVQGDNFGGKRRNAKVVFSGCQDTLNSSQWTNNQVKVKIPKGANSGNVTIYTWDSEKSSSRQVTVDPNAQVPIDLDASWLLAEGATWPGFDEWVLIMNPNTETAEVQITFLTPGGQVKGPSFQLAGQSRLSVHVNEFVPNQDVATAVTVNNNVQVCAERAMYISTADGKWGSHDSIASHTVSETWYLAEGATWPGYDEWILVMNPNPGPVDVKVAFQTPGRSIDGPRNTLAGGTRWTVHVNDFVPNQDVSTVVQSLSSGSGIVAERSMYVRTPDGKTGCHNSLGTNEASYGWGLAEGATWPGYDEWVLVQNPTGSPAYVALYFLTPEEVIYGPYFELGGGRRVSIHVNDFVPDNDVATLVLTDYEDQHIVVERSMYMSTADGKRGAHNAPGSVYACTDWYLPEGCTSYGFDEWIMVMNPDIYYWATVQLTFMTPGGPVSGPSVSLPPASRYSFHVNDYVTGDVSTKVTSDGYVACERSVYAGRTSTKPGGHCSLGILAPYLAEKAGQVAAGKTPVLKISGYKLEYAGK